MNKTVPTCSSSRQCDAGWSAARAWVSNNCGMKISTYSSDYIETYNSPPDSPNLYCSVEKNRLPNGSTVINITVNCSNIFVCRPDKYSAVINFNKSVSDYISQFEPIKIGVYLGMSDINGNVVGDTRDSYGMVAKNVSLHSRANAAGILDGDIIIKINNYRVRNQSEVTSALESISVGDDVKIEVIRGKTPITLNMKA